MRAARSVSELQPKVNNVADVIVFLEILGYTKQDALRHGFSDLRDLSEEIYQSLDLVEGGEETYPAASMDAYVKVPPTAKRIAEGLALSFGWVSSLLVLFIVGVSLWLSLIFPLKVATAFMAGLFAGIFVTEGPLQAFNRNFSFYHEQGNLPEAERVLKRSYITVGAVLAITVGVLYVAAVLAHFPLDLFAIAMVSLVTISVQRTIYAIVYSLKKTAHLIISYTLALAALLWVYFQMGSLIPNSLERYFYGLVAAVVVLSAFALYDQFQVLSGRSFKTHGPVPSFWRPININKSTIMSRFPVQFWETLPNYLFGTFFFALLFGDRVLSWFFNPVKSADGANLPFVFNSAYHSGADPALLVIFPALVIQYALMSPIFAQVTNATLERSVKEAGQLRRFISGRYVIVMAASVLTATIAAAVLDDLIPKLLPAAYLTPTSLSIFHFALVSNVFLVIFLANSLFMQFMNKITGLAVIGLIGALVVLVGGSLLGQTGFQYLILAYLAATITVAFVSTVYVLSNLGRASSVFFARYI